MATLCSIPSCGVTLAACPFGGWSPDPAQLGTEFLKGLEHLWSQRRVDLGEGTLEMALFDTWRLKPRFRKSLQSSNMAEVCEIGRREMFRGPCDGCRVDISE
uniref:Uncharacterized protein n=1 Tax=Ixodes ricinus TaxID=34613 RepID=A0A6B0UFB4_IXORI